MYIWDIWNEGFSQLYIYIYILGIFHGRYTTIFNNRWAFNQHTVMASWKIPYKWFLIEK